LSHVDEAKVQREFDRAYRGRHDQFKSVLADARDYLGRCLAAAWQTLSWDVTYSQVAAALIVADRRLAGGIGYGIMAESMEWRGIHIPDVSGRFIHTRRRRRARSA